MPLNLLIIIFSLSIVAFIVAILLLLWWKYISKFHNVTKESSIQSQIIESPSKTGIIFTEMEDNSTAKVPDENPDSNRNDELNLYRMLILATRRTIHDSKNSMINIKLAVKEVREKVATVNQEEIREEIDQQLDSITQSSTYLTRMLEGLLHNLTRIRSSALELETVNIRKLWEEEKESLRVEAKQYKVRLITLEDAPKKLLSSELEIDIDRELIRQALRELVHNGIKYSKLDIKNPNENDAKVAIGFTVDNHYLNIHILDTGCGISDDEKDKVFESGFRGKKASRAEGTGLGLYSVQTTIDAHGGLIELDNNPTKIPWNTTNNTKWSTMFIVKLPRQSE
jgi:signal transduction histidine kinase